MTAPHYIEDLMRFLDNSPVNFLAARQLTNRLDEAGYTPLDPADLWQLTPGGKYYITKNQSAVIAFALSTEGPARLYPPTAIPQASASSPMPRCYARVES